MAVTGWFYRSFANSFTLCLIVFVLHTVLALSCPFFFGHGRDWRQLIKRTVCVSQTLAANPRSPPAEENNKRQADNQQPTATRAAQANQIKQSVKLLANER